MRFVDPFEAIDYADGDDPAVLAERAESAKPETEMAGQADFISRLLGWLIAAKDLNAIGTRALFAASRIRPDVYHDGTLHSMLTPARLEQLQREFDTTFAGVSPLAGPRGAARRETGTTLR
jgi:hypothetical protein